MPKKGTKVGVPPIKDMPVTSIESETIDILKGRKNTPSPLPLFPKNKK